MFLLKINTRGFLISVSFLILTGLSIPFQTASAQKKRGRKTQVTAVSPGIVLTKNGSSPYRIVIPSTASLQEKKAASVLQDYLLQISGAALPIVSAARPGCPYEIILGQNEKLDELGITINFNELGADGFIIRTDSLRLIIAGGNDKGYTVRSLYLS